MTRDDVRRLYQQVLLTTPYNSVSQHYEFLTDERPDPRFGATCGFQAVKVGEALKALGCRDVFYLRDHRHALAVCRLGSEHYLLDPYMLHIEPIVLGDVAAHPDGREYPAYPFRVGADGEIRPSRVHVRCDPEKQVVSLEYFRYSIAQRRYALSRYFKLRLDRPVFGPPPAAEIVPLLFHPEQNNLSIRVIVADDRAVVDLIYPICYYHNDPAILPERLLIRDNAGDMVPAGERRRFARELARMAEAAQVLPRELVAFLLRGAAIYEQHAPREIAYAAFDEFHPARKGVLVDAS